MEKDRKFAERAMAIAKTCSIFPDDLRRDETGRRRTLIVATQLTQACEGDLVIINGWEKTLHEMTRKQALEQGLVDLTTLHNFQSNRISGAPIIEIMNTNVDTGPSRRQRTESSEKSSKASTTTFREKLLILNAGQRRAHDIIEKRVLGMRTARIIIKSHKRILAAQDEQLLMLVIGYAGMGKSVVIDAITYQSTFRSRGMERCLSVGPIGDSG